MKKWERNNYDCGCNIVTDNSAYFIEWCALHKFAPELLEACKEISIHLLTGNKINQGHPLHVLIENLISKVEGNKVDCPTCKTYE